MENKDNRVPVRLLAFDLDGTLLNPENRVSQRNERILRRLQEQGLKLVVTTGRTLPAMKQVCAHLPFDGYVCSNGMISYDRDYGILHTERLKGDVVRRVLAEIRKERMYYELHVESGERLISQDDAGVLENLEGAKPSGVSEGEWEARLRIRHHLNDVTEEALQTGMDHGSIHVLKVFVWHREPERLQALRERLLRDRVPVGLTASGPFNLEMNKKGVNKWTGLQLLLQRFGLSGEHVLVFGDGENDVEILSHAGRSVAMENAEEAAIEAAGDRTLSNVEDGVAHYLETWF